MKLNKNKFTFITGALLFTLALTACGLNDEPTQDSAQTDEMGDAIIEKDDDAGLQMEISIESEDKY